MKTVPGWISWLGAAALSLTVISTPILALAATKLALGTAGQATAVAQFVQDKTPETKAGGDTDSPSVEPPSPEVIAKQRLEASMWVKKQTEELIEELRRQPGYQSATPPPANSIDGMLEKIKIGDLVQVSKWSLGFLNRQNPNPPLEAIAEWAAPITQYNQALGIITVTTDRNENFQADVSIDRNVAAALSSRFAGELIRDQGNNGWFFLQDNVVIALGPKAETVLAGPISLQNYLPFLQDRLGVRPMATLESAVPASAKTKSAEADSTRISVATWVVLGILAAGLCLGIMLVSFRRSSWHIVTRKATEEELAGGEKASALTNPEGLPLWTPGTPITAAGGIPLGRPEEDSEPADNELDRAEFAGQQTGKQTPDITANTAAAAEPGKNATDNAATNKVMPRKMAQEEK